MIRTQIGVPYKVHTRGNITEPCTRKKIHVKQRKEVALRDSLSDLLVSDALATYRDICKLFIPRLILFQASLY